MENPNPDIRLYQHTDYDSCVRIFKSNIPKFFDPEELPEFEDFLKKYAAESFWIIEQNNVQVGCGGIRIRPDGTGGLCYGMVLESLHNKGFGKTLTNYRLLQLLESPYLKDITLDTSQHTYPFYERFGFKITSVQKDSYGAGLDCYNMKLLVPNTPLEREALKATIMGKKNSVNEFTSSLIPPQP